MTPLTIMKVLSLLAILLPLTASATYYYDTDDIQQRVIGEAKRQNMPPSLALAIAKVESNFNHQALSHAGAKGVMQIMPRTAEQVFGVHRSRLFDPDVNIELGVTFMKKLLKRYDGRLDIALSHYNGGSGVKNRHGEFRVMPATRDYVDNVLATQQGFLQYDKQPVFASQVNQTGINYVDVSSGEFQGDAPVFDTQAQNPQIETLRALRLHNITRNYKSNRAQPVTHPSAPLEKAPSTQVPRNLKMAKVRQWESIYPD
ncbi:lytic transglycosylase domain-containing protein [Paraglaciecola sp. MB-3u-78]|uniref:lytic transglycosylase domain-containing protein n=1 Tax=Paraglaciecola sp. MB-3u-78 TaxID=2058332 RepID=UPI000C31D469|nr:lytic transglycosylase domain-containing protein [Paraglaciecola sp. MB-3u-78]PKG95607.1 lytic transglycosylase domain-containing protein [Paraglaciecola sp. MB-3u-78]